MQAGPRVCMLGVNPVLSSAVASDIALPGMIGYAQELVVLDRPGDLLLGRSTSGRLENTPSRLVTLSPWRIK